MLYRNIRGKNLAFPNAEYTLYLLHAFVPTPDQIPSYRLDTNNFSEGACVKLFRFSQAEILLLVDSLIFQKIINK